MKKIIGMIVTLAMICGLSLAADLLPVNGNEMDRVLSELQTGYNALEAGGSLTNGVQSKGRQVVVGANSSSTLQVDSGTGTNGSAIINFNLTYASAPVVFCTWKTSQATTNCAPVCATSVNTTSFVPITATAPSIGTNFYWFAIGNK